MTVSKLCLNLVFILSVTCQCQSIKRECLAGYHLRENKCQECKNGTYTEMENAMSNCMECTACDSVVDQIEVKPCTLTQNRECGCKPGFYKIGETLSSFFCEQCDKCRNCKECVSCGETCNQENRFTTTSLCGIGLYLDDGKCLACTKSGCKSEACKNHCIKDIPPDHPDLLLLMSLIIPVIFCGLLCLLSIWFCRRKRFCQQAKNWLIGIQVQPDQPNDLFNVPSTMVRNDSACNGTSLKPCPGVPVTGQANNLFNGDWPSFLTPLISKGDPKLMQILQKEVWPAPVLYTIIREIPVPRWKEFLRLLSVTDDQIERTELDAGPSYLEKQYVTLRLWSQTGGAKLENIYSTLHYMNLSGCAQELQEKLELLQLSKCDILTSSSHV